MDALGLNPTSFFSFEYFCSYVAPGARLSRVHCLPPPADQMDIATVSLGWNEEGLQFEITVDAPFERSCHPQVEGGDAVLLFIDTRHVKGARSVHRYCHQFFALPTPVNEIQAGECTRFRPDEARPLCSNDKLSLQVQKRQRSVTLSLSIPADCLHGYVAEDNSRLGFSYLISRGWRPAQGLTGCPRELAISQHPELWATARLKQALTERGTRR